MTLIIIALRPLQEGGSWPEVFDVIYQSFSGLIFVMSLFCVVSSAFLGRWEFLRHTLGCGFFKLIAKVSFSGYLIQGMMILIHAWRQATAWAFSLNSTFYDGVANFIMILCFGGIFYILIERPFKNIESRFFQYKYIPKETQTHLYMDTPTSINISMTAYSERDHEKFNAFT